MDLSLFDDVSEALIEVRHQAMSCDQKSPEAVLDVLLATIEAVRQLLSVTRDKLAECK